MSKSDRLVPASDGHLARSVGVWSKEKLHYLQRYCTIFNTGMQHKWRHRIYIDLFSGPGRCMIRETGEEIDGSPLVALKSPAPFTDVIFNDLEPPVMDALRARTVAQRHAGVHYLAEDCNAAIEPITRLLDAIPTPSHLSLCFVDPTNWQITFSSIRRLTSGRRMDLIVVFHSAFMKRAAHLPSPRLSAFFGDEPSDPEWRHVYQEALREGRTRALLDRYRERLRGIGYTWFHDAVSVEKDNHGLPLYQMVFASKHNRGEDFWHKIAGKQHHGQLRLGI